MMRISVVRKFRTTRFCIHFGLYRWLFSGPCPHTLTFWPMDKRVRLDRHRGCDGDDIFKGVSVTYPSLDVVSESSRALVAE